jgi:uncharacterized membrane protein
MTKGRLEAFSDGVIAILITIMVLELKVPQGEDLDALLHLRSHFLAYLLSFVFLGIYWNNHHHMLHATDRVNGAVLWANLHLLFWLSLVPIATAWMGDHPRATLPTTAYGVVLLCSAISYVVLQGRIVALQGPTSRLATAVGRDRKGKVSMLLYAIAIAVASWHAWIAQGLFALVALVWLVPDRRIEVRLSRE